MVLLTAAPLLFKWFTKPEIGAIGSATDRQLLDSLMAQLEANHSRVAELSPVILEDLRALFLLKVKEEIVEAIGESDIEEGCLSVPGIYELVPRAERVKVRAYDQNGKAFTLEAQGLLSVCIQHEMDHLQGKVFIEYLSQLKQQRVRAKLAKQLRKSA